MCCEDTSDVMVPEPVAKMLAHYRALLAERGVDWGNEVQGERSALSSILGQCASFCESGALNFALEEAVNGVSAKKLFLEGALPVDRQVQVVLGALQVPLPVGVAIARSTGIEVAEKLPFALDGGSVAYKVLTVDEDLAASVITEVSVSAADPDLVVNGHRVRAVERVNTGRLRLVADEASRWTVVDERGGGWFAAGVPCKYDIYNRPFFHGNDVVLDVPVGSASVTVARGCEFRSATAEVDITASEETLLELSPTRLYDAASRGWYGGDLHVHMNYGGEQVCSLEDAARMQQGEGLHVMSLVAANHNTSLVYDQQALESFAEQEHAWKTPSGVAQFGVEFRNDMFGHFHALNPSQPPNRYQTGHVRSDEPQDWPPNSVAAKEFQDVGATVGYTHPVCSWGSVAGDDILDHVFSTHSHWGGREMHARELVADAPLGLVDSVDLTGHPGQHLERTEYLYHRLLGCGLRLAATAGTDCMLSKSRGLSNPPGWSRAYANLNGQPLSIPAWQDAVRACRTFATNGPWLEIDVAGHGPGDTIDHDGSGAIRISARVIGLGVERLELVSSNGAVAETDVPSGREEAHLEASIEVSEPTWFVAIARGKQHPATLGPKVYAHTSPIWVNMYGRSVARPEDAGWCLEWLDRFEDLARKRGNFTAPEQLQDLIDVLDQARAYYQKITSADALA